jgi:hypothetical protein
MSTNIKVNPFAIAGTWNNAGLNSVIAALPGSPTPEDVIDKVSAYLSTKMYNAAIYADIDSVSIQESVANLMNFISVNSWCNDCCDNTFESFTRLKLGIENMGFYTLNQLSYINQFLAIPCNTKITVVANLYPILSQLETNIILDVELSKEEKIPLLVLAAIAYKSLEYWEAQSTGGPTTWNPYMVPIPAADWIRPFWLYNMLGAIISMGMEIKESGTMGSNMVLSGVSGGMSGSASYAIFK